MTRHSPYRSDKLSRLAQPSELIEYHFPCGINSLAEGGSPAPILRRRLELIQFLHQIWVVDSSLSLYRRSGEGDFPVTDDARNAVDLIRKGNLIECSAEAYHSEIRDAIIRFASECADSNDVVRMRIALAEVSRLDNKHGYGPSAASSDKLTH
jgi:hypothetical protein